MKNSALRSAWYAGTWYAGDGEGLKATILDSIDAADKVRSKESPTGAIRFALLPHAGLYYSGRGIAPLLRHAPPKISRVLILAPSHSAYLPNDQISFGNFSGFDTPLGRLEAFKVSDSSQLNSVLQKEHAVEMVLPFLAYLQEEQKSPIEVAMGLISHVSDINQANILANQLIELLGEEELERGETLVIASSDFTHYGPRFNYVPYGMRANQEVLTRVKEEDLKVATLLAKGELGPLFLRQRSERGTICGIAAGAIVSALAKKSGSKGWVADYYTSLDVVKERSNDLVAYGTILWR
ncbi:MAG: AmmeMemoRadiSam system protein B [Spirochaetales bacterium]|nr:AmmeMemoRadiSam system protein B [Spirochaetales bacterium]